MRKINIYSPTYYRLDKTRDSIDSIIDSYTILFDKIYVFQNEDDAGQLICTYNIEMVEDYYDGDEAISGTISLHRKKQSNTLYTINALNETIRSLNNGVLDKSFPIPWENYQNNLLLTNEEGLNISKKIIIN